MAAMSQMQMRYFPEEDRFLLRMNTVEEEEFRFWLTRRFIQIFYPLLRDVLYATPNIKQQTNPVNKDTIFSFQEEQAKSQVEYNTTFTASAKTYPLGKQPILVSKARITTKVEQHYQLHLKDSNDKGLCFSLDQDLLHILTHLILNSLPKAEWQLSFDKDTKKEANSNTTASQGSKLLN